MGKQTRTSLHDKSPFLGFGSSGNIASTFAALLETKAILALFRRNPPGRVFSSPGVAAKQASLFRSWKKCTRGDALWRPGGSAQLGAVLRAVIQHREVRTLGHEHDAVVAQLRGLVEEVLQGKELLPPGAGVADGM